MQLRKIHKNDVKLMFDWANDSSVRENAIHTEPILWKNHQSWFYKKIEDQNSYIYILEDNENSIGQVRFDKIDGSYLIDYSIALEHRKKGYGTQIIKLGCEALENEIEESISIIAQVKETNIGSSKVFLKLGFILSEEQAIKGETYHCFSRNNYTEKYIIASEKKWNDSLLNSLKLKYPHAFFLAIRTKKLFNLKSIKEFNPTKIFFPHWSYIIPSSIFDNYECIVFHMTDLPYGRGGSPLQNLIVRGHHSTKLSSLKVVQELDAGPIYLKKELSLLGTAEEIFLRTNSLIEESISTIISEQIKPINQKGEITIFNRRKPQDSNIENLKDLDSIFNYIRMLDAEGYPKAFLENENFRLEFSRASLKSDKSILADVRILKK